MAQIELIATIAGIVGGLSLVFELLRRSSRWTGAQYLFRFRYREPIDIVLPKPKNVELDLNESPYEGVLTNLGNLKSSMAIATQVGRMRSGKRVEVNIAQALEVSDSHTLDRDLVLFGGYRGNPIVRRFLEELDGRLGTEEVVYDDDAADRNVLRVGGQEVTYDWCAQAQGRTPDFDYALVVVWRNPFTEKRRRAILSVGCTSYGTRAGIEYLIGDFFETKVSRMRPKLKPGTASGADGLRPRLGRPGSWPSFALLLKTELQSGQIIGTREVAFQELPMD